MLFYRYGSNGLRQDSPQRGRCCGKIVLEPRHVRCENSGSTKEQVMSKKGGNKTSKTSPKPQMENKGPKKK